MTDPLTDQQLAEIEALHEPCTDATCHAHRLAAEVRRQREALDKVRARVAPESNPHDRHGAQLNGLIADCAGCLAEGVRYVLGEA